MPPPARPGRRALRAGQPTGRRRLRARTRVRSLASLPTLERLQAVFLAVAIADLLATTALIATAPELVIERLAGAAAAVLLCCYWIAGFKRKAFPIAGEPLEAALAFLILCAAPGRPLLPLVAIVFRSLYFDGGFRRAFSRYGLWVGAWFAAHATRGIAAVAGDISPAAGTAFAPFAFCMLASHSKQLSDLAARRQHEATHDALTGLVNRRELLEQLAQACHAARPAGACLSLMILDLDNFKGVNDALGHRAGDQLLQELSVRLTTTCGADALVARLGGDEFAVLACGAGQTDAEDLAERICDAIERDFVLHGLQLSVRASIGIAACPKHGSDRDTLVQHADVAMYCAKGSQSRRSAYVVYDPARDEHSRERLRLSGELPGAIEQRQLILHYQPKVDLRTGQIAGVEALVRWEHPRLGLLAPGRFLPLVEQAGLMRDLTLAALEMALAQTAAWRATGLDITVAVNLGAANLLDRSLAPRVAELLQRTRVPPQALVLEVTERIVSTDRGRVQDVLAQLREHDITLSLDDFGIGSSSLGFLGQLPVQEVKLDRSFLAGVSPREGPITRAVIGLARELGLRTVVEGVEHQQALEQVAAYGADQAQGFHLARPLGQQDITRLVAGWDPSRWSLRPSTGASCARLAGPDRRIGRSLMTS